MSHHHNDDYLLVGNIIGSCRLWCHSLHDSKVQIDRSVDQILLSWPDLWRKVLVCLSTLKARQARKTCVTKALDDCQGSILHQSVACLRRQQVAAATQHEALPTLTAERGLSLGAGIILLQHHKPDSHLTPVCEGHGGSDLVVGEAILA